LEPHRLSIKERYTFENHEKYQISFLVGGVIDSLAGKISLTAATETNSWLLTSPDGQCAITVRSATMET